MESSQKSLDAKTMVQLYYIVLNQYRSTKLTHYPQMFLPFTITIDKIIILIIIISSILNNHIIIIIIIIIIIRIIIRIIVVLVVVIVVKTEYMLDRNQFCIYRKDISPKENISSSICQMETIVTFIKKILFADNGLWYTVSITVICFFPMNTITYVLSSAIFQRTLCSVLHPC